MKAALPKRTAKTSTRDRRSSAARWMKFNVVGGIGIGVQWAVLLYLQRGFRLSYLLATALAVEAAVVHNFFWHERFTWGDQVHVTWRHSMLRLLRFNFTTGAVSILGNHEVTGRRRTPELLHGQRHHDSGVLGGKLCGQQSSCLWRDRPVVTQSIRGPYAISSS